MYFSVIASDIIFKVKWLFDSRLGYVGYDILINVNETGYVCFFYNRKEFSIVRILLFLKDCCMWEEETELEGVKMDEEKIARK